MIGRKYSVCLRFLTGKGMKNMHFRAQLPLRPITPGAM
jgi:hypothetical protein